MRSWTKRHWLIAAAGAVVAALVIGVPTGVVPTPLYTRMTPVLWWNYPVWAVSAVLTGLITGTYVRASSGSRPRQGRAVAGGLLSVFAVGCPICNKLVVLALGTSGALSYFAPLQPVLALASLAVLAVALRQRLRAQQACPVPESVS
ncbi:MAG: hypothetical protein GEV07_30725 [Streptosporangiales bacterium]|nr:hypothetical protein [Streptosporangiales bacterium]